MKAVAVSIEGPYPMQNHEGDECPYWSACLVDDEGEPVGDIWTVLSYRHACELGEGLAKRHGLPLENDGSPD